MRDLLGGARDFHQLWWVLVLDNATGGFAPVSAVTLTALRNQ